MKTSAKQRNCRFMRVCKSTKKGTWLDCSRGKGFVCDTTKPYCSPEPFKPPKEEKSEKPTNFEALISLSLEDFAYSIVFDDDGEQRGVCSICQRHKENNCDDRCIVGVIEYLQKKKEK